MKIFYDHIYGNTTKYDIIYGLALAEVEKDEGITSETQKSFNENING